MPMVFMAKTFEFGLGWQHMIPIVVPVMFGEVQTSVLVCSTFRSKTVSQLLHSNIGIIGALGMSVAIYLNYK